MTELQFLFAAVFKLLNDRGVIDADEYEHIVSSIKSYKTVGDTVGAINEVIASDFVVRKKAE